MTRSWAETRNELAEAIVRARREAVKTMEVVGVNPVTATWAWKALRQLHVPTTGIRPLVLAMPGVKTTWCTGCNEVWPCQVTQLLDEAERETAAVVEGKGHPVGCRCNAPYPCGREGESDVATEA